MGGTREFNLALIGYDRQQVDEFRDETDAMLEELRTRVVELEQELERMQHEKPITANQAFANVARETQRILQAAQDAGARMLGESREQADNELAHARRERSQIVGDGYRARDEMSEQLRHLDKARARLIRQLQDASAEIQRVSAGLESSVTATDEAAAPSRRMVERARTGTDEGPRPFSSGASLRVIAGDDTRQRQRPRTLPRRSEPPMSDAGPGGDLLADKRDQLAPLRVALIERLSDELGVVRDQLRERVRRSSDAGDATGDITFDAPAIARVAEAGATQLRQAFELGAAAAAAGRRDLETATSTEDVGSALIGVLDERVGAPIRALLSDGEAADDPPWVLVERIEGVISDASAAMVAQIAETELSRAYERGKLATWTAGGVEARRWIASPRGHRSDAACRTNARAGAMVLPTPFSSGDVTPPRFDGCTCTTDAASKESDP